MSSMFDVSVEKRMYCIGVVQIEAASPDEAQEKVEAMINIGELQTTAVEWSDPTYEDMTFTTTGDVDGEGI